MCFYLPSLAQEQGTFSGSAILHVFHVKQQEVPDSSKEKNLSQFTVANLEISMEIINRQSRLIGLKESLRKVVNIERNLYRNLQVKVNWVCEIIDRTKALLT